MGEAPHSASASTSEKGRGGGEDAKLPRAFEGDAEEGDVGFKEEVQVHTKAKWWHGKYEARKPRYFNRVHTGYEWTKYNQTHYDQDNPPPKVVQGYKFNIFYPDLVKGTPSYKILKDPDS